MGGVTALERVRGICRCPVPVARVCWAADWACLRLKENNKYCKYHLQAN